LEKLYIILPVYNRAELTLKFIESLKDQSFQNYCLLLVDDGSTDGTGQKVKENIPGAVVLKGKGDWWWAGSIQQAYYWLEKNAEKNSKIVIANDDLTFEKDYLQKGIDYLKKNPDSFILSAAYNQDKPAVLEDCGVVYDFKLDRITSCDVNQLDKLNCVSTRGLFLETKDFLRTGGFRPRLLPHYYSDYEFSIRAKKKFGMKLKCFLDLKVFMNTTSTGVEEITFSTVKEYCKKAFSKRYKTNPRYAFTYYLITFPFPYNFKFSFLQLRHFLKTFFLLLFKF
jgi:GT2 family glycosyltransferase